MVNMICQMKGDIIKQVRAEIDERGMERMNVGRIGEMIDMVKDLAEAEEKYWKGQYYRNLVTDAMETKYGGYTDSGSAMQEDDIVEQLSHKYQTLSPEEKFAMKSKVLMKLGSM